MAPGSCRRGGPYAHGQVGVGRGNRPGRDGNLEACRSPGRRHADRTAPEAVVRFDGQCDRRLGPVLPDGQNGGRRPDRELCGLDHDLGPGLRGGPSIGVRCRDRERVRAGRSPAGRDLERDAAIGWDGEPGVEPHHLSVREHPGGQALPLQRRRSPVPVDAPHVDHRAREIAAVAHLEPVRLDIDIETPPRFFARRCRARWGLAPGPDLERDPAYHASIGRRQRHDPAPRRGGGLRGEAQGGLALILSAGDGNGERGRLSDHVAGQLRRQLHVDDVSLCGAHHVGQRHPQGDGRARRACHDDHRRLARDDLRPGGRSLRMGGAGAADESGHDREGGKASLSSHGISSSMRGHVRSNRQFRLRVNTTCRSKPGASASKSLHERLQSPPISAATSPSCHDGDQRATS